ncbi:MAG: type IX secretion system sortase PorU [Saprospiraceae bacterium]|nr:type IX secretion system sortase PorU [Saprospiraceae bacterium]
MISGLDRGMVWDITDPFAIKAHLSADGAGAFSFTHNHNGLLKRYAGFQPEDVTDTPVFIKKIANQNLHGINEADMVIIYPEEFSEAAMNLKNHRNDQGFNVITVEIEQIFNEYSGGKRDPVSIRDFSKMVYERDPDYRYLLLLGDGSYDYKNIVPGLPDHNFIPVYETNESLHPIESFPSDDFFALLSDFEGDDLRGQLEIAVGRIPAKSPEEANAVINKIIKYETDENTLGDWRLRIGFTADDEDSNTHLNQAERIANNTKDKYPLFNQQKVYFDAYNQESTPGGARYPDASKAINDNIFKGQLVLNYLGHGGPRGWAQERVLKVNDILSWENEDKMPLIITATCSFTGYDDPGLISAGEYAILKEDGGAIGLMTTVRAVYSLENERLTASVFDTIFSSSGNTDLTIGEIIQRAKNNNWQDTTRINARKFALIGDPSMKLTIPHNRIITTHINDQQVGVATDTIGALMKVKVNGIITDRNGNKLENYRGTIYPTVYDKESELATLRNDSRSRVSNFQLHKSILFKGAATIENGEFSFEFIVPIDIDYSIGQGRISYYAESSDLTSDGGGFYNEIIIGGSSEESLTDDIGPDINIFMNDERFVYGGTTHPNPVLLVKLSDDNGINVTGNSIGHDLVAVLDGNNQNAFLLNDFYEASVDDYKSGIVKFPMNELEPGRHTISVKAWDVANNSSEQILEFIVVDEDSPVINNIYNYPNPFSTNTSFMFEHTMQGGELDILVYIYTLSGKLVKTIQESIINTGTRVNDIQWNGRDEFDDKLGKGIYLYKIKLTDRELNVTEESNYQKLVIIN